ncbi:MAG: phosphoenolpyruvate--protein phosphotransferase [Deltaproteobacteria bacterium]|nr:phosphoenolpyruvate--protein phosphotransferase [Deltaproteobacteria bacterium]
MTNKPENLIFNGIGISPGIVIGKVRLIDRKKVEVTERKIREKNVEYEVGRFEDAVKKAKKQLIKVKKKVFGEEKKDHLFIIDVHLMMLEDRMLLEDTIRNIRHERINAEWALTMVIDELKKMFQNIDDYYLRERSGDISYVGEMILRNLSGEEHEKISKIEEKVVIVAHDLSPADTAQMNKENIVAFATDIGGKTSHTAIIARALEIPAVGGLEEITGRVKTGDHIIVDGLSGKVIINPGKKLFREYLNKQQRYHYIEKEILKYADLPAVTPDGKRLHIAGNIEIVEEIPSLLSHGAEGIGLYRTEFLYMNRGTLPLEEEHFDTYCDVIEKVSPNPVTIRTLDLGMDKIVPFFESPVELNPALGLRSIRFSLQEREVFKVQLRAILRASAFGSVKIMFPMISGVEEVREAKSILNEAKEELVKEGIAFDKAVETGIMIEVPSATLIADILAKEVDFFSIGTNDLIQYSLAIDRVNEHVAYLYEPLHPAVLRMVKSVVHAGHNAGINVSMCGEMAGDPVYSIVLLGLGLDTLSMSAFSIPRVKKVLRSVSSEEARFIADKAMSLSTAKEIRDYIHGEIKVRFQDDLWEEFNMEMSN